MDSLITAFATIVTILLLCWQSFKFWCPWLPEDLMLIWSKRRSENNMKRIIKERKTFPDRLEEVAKINPDKSCILFEDEVWTYKQMNQWVIQATRALHRLGIEKGDKIALMMNNEPAYAAILLASMRIGSEIALINYNLRSKVLIHSLNISEAKLLIIGREKVLYEAVKEISDEIDMKLVSYTAKLDGSDSLENILMSQINGLEAIQRYIKHQNEAISRIPAGYQKIEETVYLKRLSESQPSHELEEHLRPSFPLTNIAAYIYTSGTTGKPKAVEIPYTMCQAGAEIYSVLEHKDDDVLYCALPFYHTAGSMLGLLPAINLGITLALRRRFSASNFLKDCQKYNVTGVQYIGETLRYVCLQPLTGEEGNNKIRWAIGNGLRQEVWKTFLDRFGKGIHVYEFYGATDGHVFFINNFNKFGLIGTCSPLTKAHMGVAFVKYDHDEDVPYRDSKGRCVEVGLNEPGLLISRITATARPRDYKGSKEAYNKKLLRNVFKVGDCYFNSGDLMMRESHYGLHFCDRVGDTFRWRGENVSTNEVADVLATFPGVEVANVYGVQIKGKDGRAGMVALVLNADLSSFNMKSFYKYCVDNLPKYAVPLFIRICRSLDHTGTMKLKKVYLKLEGFDLTKIKEDKLYFMDQTERSFDPLTQNIAKDIEEGKVKI